MTTTLCRLLKVGYKRAAVNYITFSGTVKVDGTNAIRKIYGYKLHFPEILTETVSDASGDWELLIRGGIHDKFRIICVGEEGENSQIYEHMME